MERKAVRGIMLTLLLTSMLTLAFNIQPVRAEGGIFDDDFETYSLGNLHNQGGWNELDGYTNWKVVDMKAYNDIKSIYIDRYYELTNRVAKFGEGKPSGIQSAWIYFSDRISGTAIFSPVFELLSDYYPPPYPGMWVNAYGIIYNTSTLKWEFAYYSPDTFTWVVLNPDVSKDEWHSIEAKFDEPNWRYQLRLNGGEWSDWISFHFSNMQDETTAIIGLRINARGQEVWVDTIDGEITPPTPDFSITASPTSLVIQQGNSDTSVITVTSIGGFNQPVQLTVSGAPSGVTTTLNPEQVTPPPDGSTTSTLTVSVDTTATPGSYTLTVTGTNDTQTHSVDISLEITAPLPNEPPIASFVYTPQKPIVNEEIIFNAYASYDPDGHIVAYEWNFGDGNTTTTNTPSITHLYKAANRYNVTLTVKDNQGATACANTTIIVKKAWAFAIITDLHVGISYDNSANSFPDYGGLGWHDGDSGQDYCLTRRLENIVNKIKELDRDEHTDYYIRFVVVLGDIADSAEDSEFLKAMEILNRLNDPPDNIPYIPIIGNHDVLPYIQRSYWGHVTRRCHPGPPEEADSASGKYFEGFFWNEFRNARNMELIRELFGDSWRRQEKTDPYLQNYVFTYKGYKFVALDFVSRTPIRGDTAGVPSTAQFFSDTWRWLNESLIREYRFFKEPTIIFSHHPLWTNYVDAFTGSEVEDIQASIRDSLGSDVRANFAGHVHKNDKQWSAGTWVVTTEAAYQPAWDVLRIAKVDGYSIDYSNVYEVPSQEGMGDLYQRMIEVVRGSPCELRVYDSSGRVTGLVNGEERNEIPNTIFSEDIVVILNATDTYRYEVVGLSEGVYDLTVANITEGVAAAFTASYIPMSADTIHQYTIDWAALSWGEEGVTVQIDSDGDGTFERTITSDGVLTRDEFLRAGPPVGGVVIPVDKPALLAPWIFLTMLVTVAAMSVTIYSKKWSRKKFT